MRKLLFASLSAAVLIGLLGATGTQAASIVGSHHDMNTLAPAVPGAPPSNGTTSIVVSGNDGEICIFCHIPHNAAATEVPLWWRNAPVTTTWTMYDSPTFESTQASSPQGVSLACLSCHDGATAFDALIHAGDLTVIAQPSGLPATMADVASWMNIGNSTGNLANDHPISITYGTASELNTQASVETAGLRFFGSGTDQMECATCHAVHDPAIAPFLRLANTGSALCLTCHVK